MIDITYIPMPSWSYIAYDTRYQSILPVGSNVYIQADVPEHVTFQPNW